MQCVIGRAGGGTETSARYWEVSRGDTTALLMEWINSPVFRARALRVYRIGFWYVHARAKHNSRPGLPPLSHFFNIRAPTDFPIMRVWLLLLRGSFVARQLIRRGLIKRVWRSPMPEVGIKRRGGPWERESGVFLANLWARWDSIHRAQHSFLSSLSLRPRQNLIWRRKREQKKSVRRPLLSSASVFSLRQV